MEGEFFQGVFPQDDKVLKRSTPHKANTTKLAVKEDGEVGAAS